MIKSRRRTQQLYDVLAYVILIGAFTFAVFPILWTLLTSLKSNADIVTAEIQYIPLRPSLQNYATLWAQAGFPTMFFNSAVVTVLTVDPREGPHGHGQLPGADISLHLARHGVNAEIEQTVSADLPVGDEASPQPGARIAAR